MNRSRWWGPAGMDGIAALILAGVFLAAAIPKMLDPAGFALSIYRYHLLPGWTINPLAIILPWVELVAAGALLWPRHRGGAALLLGVLLIVFTLALGSALARGLDVTCGCFSTNPDAARAGIGNLVRNLALLAAAGWLLKRPGTS